MTYKYGRGRGCKVIGKSHAKGPVPTHLCSYYPFTAPAASPRKRTWYACLALLFFAVGLGAQPELLLVEALSANPARQVRIAGELQQYNHSDFGPAAAEHLGHLLDLERLPAREEYILLAGFLGRSDLLERLPEPARNTKSVRQSINLARVRAGNAERAANLLKNLQRLEVNDELVYDLLPSLIYTRDRGVFDWLWASAMTENRACYPADAETPGRIDCAYRLVEALGPAIENFPVAVDADAGLLTDDYPAALLSIRRWYAANADTYLIRTDTF